ncbi:Dihydrofolate reductase [Rosistilla carotiformis]|uniref:Dihydrofolate reductase n=1 Tax=Rosistilla carotiformis TaxID=2528017 RepID=A0A518JZ92_9BACT|nr:dihydrofolate reductase [Rosistilla carotiformis]QDV70876.1 Dihydrofolate reductase [Rosistilla carotiformis]
MIIISAMSEDRVIGSQNGMPWNVPAEYQQYLDFVAGQTVIMGRKTYEIFGKDVAPETSLIVVSRSTELDDIPVAKSFDEAIAMAKALGKEIFIAGGSSIYEQAFDVADQMYLSTIHGEYRGDAYFPAFDTDQWQVVETREQPQFTFRRWKRKAGSR